MATLTPTFDGSHRWYGGNSEVSLWPIDKPLKSDLHPTMKPVELYMRAIRNSSVPGEIVIDHVCGSGPVFIACETLGRRAFGSDNDPGYVAVTLERWYQLTGITPQLMR